ncbi:DUF501 domain-containing protein [Mucisphaera sp.]|uniref:DUF501 domain-containing protein n=1 Tax=Mucisphaera sp. TaxID=2913024 RepID=UPI003D09D968
MTAPATTWSLTDTDRQTLTNQLGRPPRGQLRVVVRHPDTTPAVIQTYPAFRTADGRLEPFPNLYYLTHPTLCAVIGQLESAGWITRLEQIIAADPNLITQLTQDHNQYRQTRWNLLTPEDQQELTAAGRAPALQQTGIGGIAYQTQAGPALKCLHLHTAHHLAAQAENQTTTVGQLMIQHQLIAI